MIGGQPAPPEGAPQRPAPRRVLVIGGLAWSLVNFRLQLMRRMVANGHEVIAAAPDFDPATQAILEAARIDPVHVPMDRTGINPRHDLETLDALRRLIRQRRPDVVLAYTMKPIVYGCWAARLEGDLRCHPLFTGLGYAFSDPNPTGKRRAVRAAAILLHRHALRSVRLGFVYNDADRADLRRFRMVPASARLVPVPGSGADTAHFTPQPLPAAPPLVFLFVGRMLFSKGLTDLRDAARLLRASVEEGAARALAGLAETGDRLHGDLGGLLARIETANAALSELVSGAGENLGAIEAGLAGRVEQIQTALGRIAAETVRASDGVGAQIGLLQEVSQGALKEASALAGALDTHGRSLAERSRGHVVALTDAAGTLAEVGLDDVRVTVP